MPRSISKKSARHLSYLLPILLATGCSQTGHKTSLTPTSTSKFSVFTRSHHGKLRFDDKDDESKENATIWDRMLSLYALPEVENSRIDREVNFYLRNPNYLARVQQRAEPYLYFILNEIEAKNIPGELALLPVIESAFRPDAESPAKASGLWQFIPPTGKLYGLEQNSWYDGRRDIVESTQAATTFLKQLSEEFDHDWLLALASYNAGKGNIRHAMERNLSRGQPADFWSLDLNHETATYVPRLLAVAKIFANPEKYNLSLQQIANAPYFELVDVKSQIDLAKAAEMAQTSLEDFLKLNPAFNRWSTAPDGPHHLLVPVEKADAFKEKLAGLSSDARIKWEYHTVGKKESLKSIAKHHHASLQQIKEVNHLDDNAVEQGKTLLIPVSFKSIKGREDTEVASTDTGQEAQQATAAKERPNKQLYTVKKGDTLWAVSQKFNVDQQDVVNWNKLSAKKPLKAGQKLKILKTGDAIAVASTGPTFKHISYTVKPGDSLAQISKKFKVNVTDLRKWNNVPKNRSELKPGSKLKITVEVANSSS
ncbi:LysM peptidoglycan-binding domain-containing protein [Methylomonas sp. HYX-M1]|uniref:lytic transglycosylase n=1 Tax=Methylomonas sp. HYX-M1 TaxID=3139307 RepID=UPI00345B6C68